MTEQQQATLMTEQQLMDAGYKVYKHKEGGMYEWHEIATPEGWRDGLRIIGTNDEAGWQHCLRRATAHYQQQQELARLREDNKQMIAALHKIMALAGESYYESGDQLAALNSIESIVNESLMYWEYNPASKQKPQQTD